MSRDHEYNTAYLVWYLNGRPDNDGGQVDDGGLMANQVCGQASKYNVEVQRRSATSKYNAKVQRRSTMLKYNIGVQETWLK